MSCCPVSTTHPPPPHHHVVPTAQHMAPLLLLSPSYNKIRDKLEKPIRVIDIETTLSSKRGIHFTTPQDWCFHVLSHTWSALVREMSHRIGLSIGSKVEKDHDTYCMHFTQDFNHEPCYKQLLEIFEVLHSDGVKLLWFDALCINQSSEEEKSQEINNMGQYFSLSKGSYVLTHGIGKVNEMWGDAPGQLPRWFSRVWTFQEFLLPQQVTFLVEGGMDPKFIGIMNKLIKENARKCLCKCFVNMPSQELNNLFLHYLTNEDLEWMGGFELRNPQWKSIVQLVDERSPNIDYDREDDDDQVWSHGPTCYKYPDICCTLGNISNKMHRHNLLQDKKPWHGQGYSQLEICKDTDEDIMCVETTCQHCGSRPLIRKAKKRTCLNGSSYFVDRELYLGMMQCHSRMMEIDQKVDVPSQGIQALRGLYCALATEGNWRPCHVICEVGWRDCTNEEDRVLAILGLLGLRLKKLRTGKPLNTQILQLAEVGGSPMLVELCTINQKGGRLPGMSWAPDFHGRNEKLEHASRPKEVYMKVERLNERGHLQVKAKLAYGEVVPISTGADPVSNYYLVIYESSFDDRNHAAKATREVSRFLLKLETRNEYLRREDGTEKPLHVFYFDFSEDNVNGAGSFEVPAQMSAVPYHSVSFPVCLLLLAKDEAERKLLLICLPSRPGSAAREELHKIGSMGLDADVHVPLHDALDSCNMQDCVIGGFGEDLASCISVS